MEGSFSKYPDKSLGINVILIILSYDRMGAGSWDYKRLTQEVDLSTGGLNVGTHLNTHHTIDNAYEQVS